MSVRAMQVPLGSGPLLIENAHILGDVLTHMHSSHRRGVAPPAQFQLDHPHGHAMMDQLIP